MNHFTFFGRAVDVPGLFQSEKSTFARFRIAVKRDFAKNASNRITDFFDCICFGRLAHAAHRNIGKGARIVVSGSVNTIDYSMKDGTKGSKVTFNVSHIQIIDWANRSSRESIKPIGGNKTRYDKFYSPAEYVTEEFTDLSGADKMIGFDDEDMPTL